MQCEWLLIFAKNKRAKHARRARLRRKATQGELILLNGTLRAALQNLSICGRGERGEREEGGERDCGVASLGESNMKIWYQKSRQRSNYHRQRDGGLALMNS